MMPFGLVACGCEGLEWTRAIGHYPGDRPERLRVLRLSAAPRLRSSSSRCRRSKAPRWRPFETWDSGTSDRHGPARTRSVALTMHTPDGRPATITFSPQNAMTNMRINIGPVHLGDEMLSRDVFRRVALNFGTLPRDYMPLEPTLSRRINHPAIMPPPAGAEPPLTLEGEGFRPGEEPHGPVPRIHVPRHRDRFGCDRTTVRSLPAFHPHPRLSQSSLYAVCPLALRAIHTLDCESLLISCLHGMPLDLASCR